MDFYFTYLESTFIWAGLKYRLCGIHEIHLRRCMGIAQIGTFLFHRHFPKHLQRLMCNQVTFGQLALAILNDIILSNLSRLGTKGDLGL